MILLLRRWRVSSGAASSAHCVLLTVRAMAVEVALIASKQSAIVALGLVRLCVRVLTEVNN